MHWTLYEEDGKISKPLHDIFTKYTALHKEHGAYNKETWGSSFDDCIPTIVICSKNEYSVIKTDLVNKYRPTE